MMSEEVKELLGKSDTEITTYLKTCKFKTQALGVHLTSMDDRVSRPAAVFYGGSHGGWQVVEELHQRLRVIDVCEGCLLEKKVNDCSYKCHDCWSSKRLCLKCLKAGFKEWHPAARPCTDCHEKKQTCFRLLQLGAQIASPVKKLLWKGCSTFSQ